MLTLTTIPRLLDRQLVRLVGRFEVEAQDSSRPLKGFDGYGAFVLTPLGLVVAKFVKSGMRTYKADKPTELKTDELKAGEPRAEERASPVGE